MSAKIPRFKENDYTRALGITALPLACDMDKVADIPPMVEKGGRGAGAIDILVTTAGTSWGAPTIDHLLNGWQKWPPCRVGRRGSEQPVAATRQSARAVAARDCGPQKYHPQHSVIQA